eukprot:TRINITY_DN88596_c0_g1_i1.p1 TRINITY_DN88596_c0_g1~~TRINITY_DN88596_c0_g1_i1.p1  ORF type:complete len:194 (+),score=47.50 TRINITY_DN88596_c0_g1_i1:75-584(+)
MVLGSLRIFTVRAARASVGAGALSAGFSAARWPSASSPALCDGGSNPFSGMKLPSSMEELVPLGESISVGGLSGFCSGFALKKVGKAAAVIFGGIFALQQALAYNGYVTVNWEKVEKDMSKLLDTNKDGKLDAKDLGVGYKKALEILQYNNAGLSGGFAGGFLLGVRYG